MAIKVVPEPEWMIKEIKVYEDCVFCLKSTNTWHLGTNQPVCADCAKIKLVKDIPKKQP